MHERGSQTKFDEYSSKIVRMADILNFKQFFSKWPNLEFQLFSYDSLRCHKMAKKCFNLQVWWLKLRLRPLQGLLKNQSSKLIVFWWCFAINTVTIIFERFFNFLSQQWKIAHSPAESCLIGLRIVLNCCWDHIVNLHAHKWWDNITQASHHGK